MQARHPAFFLPEIAITSTKIMTIISASKIKIMYGAGEVMIWTACSAALSSDESSMSKRSLPITLVPPAILARWGENGLSAVVAFEGRVCS